MRAVEMQPAVIQALNVQNQQQQQIAQPQINQEAFAAALARTASLRPEQVQEMEASPGKEKPDILTEERGETPQRRRGRSEEGEEPAAEPAPAEPVRAEDPSAATGTRIDIVV